jgi:hypothetical protein
MEGEVWKTSKILIQKLKPSMKSRKMLKKGEYQDGEREETRVVWS